MLALLLSLCVPATTAAQTEAVIQPWSLLGDNLERIYGWPNVLFHVGAAAVTPPLVAWADEPVQTYFQRRDPFGDALGPAALIGGGLLPVLLPASLYLGGMAGQDAELATAGAAAIQAEVVQFVVVDALKWLTDRAGPFPDGDPTKKRWSQSLLRDSTHADDFNFNPFDLKGGLRWPSGHTASNVALVAALSAFYPDEPWLPLIGYPLALIVGVGMIEGDYHWLSDVIAGALIGHVIGWQIGAGFRERFELQRDGRTQVRAPLASATLAPSVRPLGLRIQGPL